VAAYNVTQLTVSSGYTVNDYIALADFSQCYDTVIAFANHKFKWRRVDISCNFWDIFVHFVTIFHFYF